MKNKLKGYDLDKYQLCLRCAGKGEFEVYVDGWAPPADMGYFERRICDHCIGHGIMLKSIRPQFSLR